MNFVLRRRDIPGILRRWNLQALEAESFRSIYRVRTDRGVKCLKVSLERTAKVRFVASVVEHAWRNGFTLLPRFIPTAEGQPFLSLEDRVHCLLTDWLSGEEPGYRDVPRMAEAARTLARFHLAGQGLPEEPGAKPKVRLGRTIEQLEKRIEELINATDRAGRPSDPSPFDRQVAGAADQLLALARLSRERLVSSPYRSLCEAAAAARPVCHGDPAARNFVYGGDGQAYLIDFDSVGVDLPVTDLWKLCRRTLRRTGWRLAPAQVILGSYASVRPLAREEYQVLHALLTFPERPWRLARVYYRRREKRDWSDNRWVKEMRGAVGQIEECKRFLAEFERACL